MFPALPDITSYEVTLTTPGGEVQSVMFAPEDIVSDMMTYTFEDLLPGEMYSVDLKITNADGNEVTFIESVILPGIYIQITCII